MEVKLKCLNHLCHKVLVVDWPIEEGCEDLVWSVLPDPMNGVLINLFAHHEESRLYSEDPDVSAALAQTHHSGHADYIFIGGVDEEFAHSHEVTVSEFAAFIEKR